MSTKAFHGGASFGAIGVDFSSLERRSQVIDADVLDAWYPPSPGVIEAIQPHLEWLIKTSPPTHGEGLVGAIAGARDLAPEQLLIGGGTSSLMFSCIPRLLPADQTALILDPMYGEYEHLVRHVIGAQLKRHDLAAERGFRPDPIEIAKSAEGCAILFLVNPNSPTGVLMPRSDVRVLLQAAPPETLVWIDETYIDYAPGETAEPLIREFQNLIISKSMSKFYALSGLRIGYLATDAARVQGLQRWSPPWSVGLIGQVAAVAALKAEAYYQKMASVTAGLREAMIAGLQDAPLEIFPSQTNYFLFQLREEAGAQALVDACKADNVWLRNCASLSPRFGDRFVRSAVKDAAANQKIVASIRRALGA